MAEQAPIGGRMSLRQGCRHVITMTVHAGLLSFLLAGDLMKIPMNIVYRE